MIRINLLPEDYRRAERTSPKLFATVLLSVVCVCCAFGWFALVYFGELGRLEVQHSRVRDELAGMQEQVQYHGALSKEQADFRERAQTIQQISKSRIMWSRVLDEMVDLVNINTDADGPRVWLKSLRVTDGKGANEGPKLQMPGLVQGSEMRLVADFFDNLYVAPFYEHVKVSTYPTGSRVIDEDRDPSEAMSFPLELAFKPAAKWREE